ncbi:hypothetical protein KEM54_000913 [Ascosphaera aggregata]|nr:hypothetical protein KEM54_000913 [Ascosphaera aggregata]
MAEDLYPMPCPFCAIASASPPARPVAQVPAPRKSEDEDAGTSNVVLSTRSVLAFLDIMPLTKGHLLVIPRKHYQRLKDVSIADSMEVWTEPDHRGDDPAHWNVLQNNGIRASQTVPHVHFHIVPRPPMDYEKASLNSGVNQRETAAIVLGKGQRDDLDDEDAGRLSSLLRNELAAEIERVKKVEGIDLDGDFYGDGAANNDGKVKL